MHGLSALFVSSAPHVLGILIFVLAMCYAYHFHSSLVMYAIFGSTSPYCTDRAYNYPIVRIERIDNLPVNTMVINEMQFSDRQLHLTGSLSLSIRTGYTMTFSDRVS